MRHQGSGNGVSRREAAELLEVTVSSAVKWLQRWRDSGSAVANPRGGSISPLEKFATRILTVIAEHRDLTLVETVALLRKQRIRTSRSSPWRFLNRHKISLKKHCKRRSGSADGGSGSKACLSLPGWHLLTTPQSAPISPRLRSRAPRGIRVIGRVPLGTWKTITFVAALRHNKIAAPMVVEGAMNGEMFLTYVQERLAPTLRRGNIVVMDNPQAHKVAGIQEAIESRRATPRYLPKYSPDLNPIELVYSKMKALLRKVAAPTVEALVRTIRSFVPLLDTQKRFRYLRYAGYASV
jgi:transposase